MTGKLAKPFSPPLTDKSQLNKRKCYFVVVLILMFLFLPIERILKVL